MNPENGKPAIAGVPPKPDPKPGPFDQPVVLQQSRFWSRGIIWSIIGVTTFGLIWAAVARLEEAVPAQGKLEAKGSTQEIKVPSNGVVKTVYVEDGQQVKQGQKLLSLDSSAAAAQKLSLQNIKANLRQENALYTSLMQDQVVAPPSAAILKINPGLASVARSRVTLANENRLFRAELNNKSSNLSADQRERLQSSQVELDSRRQAAQLEVSQLQEQLAQAKAQLAGAIDILKINQGILKDIEPLKESGALSRIQYLKQFQDVRTQQVEVDRYTQEIARLTFAITQARQKLTNTVAISRKDLLTQIAENDKKIAEIDSQFSKALVENQKKLDETDSQLSQAEQVLRYQDVHSPIEGVVFDLKAAPGYVANPNVNEALVKVVPNRNLVAKVYITNQDIGFVRKGMKADVRIDSFPFSEFGDVKGELAWVGDDALPPTEERKFVAFPAKVNLDRQFMMINGKKVRLQSGMAVSVNIKIRDRSVLNLFTDLFSRQVEPLKNVR
ncbi:MAG: HlyD family secretion protein [Aphanocapsa sp. GSE-SYN-MK-11-07L]|jgi:HlyD family secretion protein|nr:HlyD family secretion protein [Aphanocapsa sp. GSE-SYN-MK-11-07L]